MALGNGFAIIGGAVLVCGLGWALVSYADNLAVRLCQRGVPIKAIEGRRMSLIRLNGSLSGGVIVTTIALLISSNVRYLKTVHEGFFESDEVKGYAILFVFMLGILFISWSRYIAIARTRSAERANIRSCAAHPSGPLPADADNQRINGFLTGLRDGHSTVLRYLRSTSGKITTVRTAREIAFIIWVTLGTALAVYMTSTAVGRDHWAAVIWVVGLYIIARLFALNRSAARETAGKGYISTNQEADESVDRIRIKYSVGCLSTATRGVVVLAILGAFFDVALTQGAFGGPQSVITLFLGGLFPAALLTGLSHSIPAVDVVATPQEPEALTDPLALAHLGDRLPGHV